VGLEVESCSSPIFDTEASWPTLASFFVDADRGIGVGARLVVQKQRVADHL